MATNVANPTFRSEPRRSGHIASTVLIVGGIVFLSLLAGAAVGFGGALLAAVMGGIIFGVGFFAIPLRYVLLAQLLLIFLVVGQLQYFAGVSRAFWLPYGLGVLMWIRLPLLALGGSGRMGRGGALVSGRAFRYFEVAMCAFVLVVAASTLLNRSSLLQVFVSIKEYLYLWSFYLVIALGYLDRDFLHRVWKALIWVLPLQLPVIVYQHFFVAKARVGASSWDAVVGLFGGNPESGGASGAMAMFTVFIMLFAIALWQRRLMPKWQFFLLLGTGLASLALTEVKVVLILIPVGIAVLYSGEILQRPIRSFGMVAAALGVTFLVLMAYQSQFQGSGSTRRLSVQEYVDQMVDRTTNTSFVNLATGEMGRVSALTFWWQRHGNDQPVHLFLGHGMGSSRFGSIVVGEVAREYRFRIDRSSLAILLWEAGLVGAAFFCAVLLGGAVAARRLVRRFERDDRFAAAVLSASSAGLSIFLIGLPYNTDMINVAPIQFTTILMLAYVTYQSRRRPHSCRRTTQGRGTGAQDGAEEGFHERSQPEGLRSWR